MKLTKSLVVGAFLAAGAGSAQASVVVSTGTGWTLTNYVGNDAAAASYIGKAATVAPDNGQFPFPNWAHPISGSQYITPSPTPSQSFDMSGVDGFYTFTSSSFLLGANAVLSGSFLADNAVKEIFLTSSAGVQTIFPSAGNFKTPTSFAFSPVASGSYTLNFLVQNYNQGSGNPVGLDAIASAVPEPSTWAMMILGFLGLGFLGYKKSRAADTVLLTS